MHEIEVVTIAVPRRPSTALPLPSPNDVAAVWAHRTARRFASNRSKGASSPATPGRPRSRSYSGPRQPREVTQ